MGILIRSRRLLFEDDNTFSSGGTSKEEDNKENSNESKENKDTSSENNSEDNNEPEVESEDNDITDDINSEEDDFSIDADMNDISDENNDNDSKEDLSNNNDTSDEKIDPTSIKSLDKELFDSLSTQEQNLKIKNLKTMFTDLYSSCNNITDKFNSLSLEADEVNLQTKKVVSIIFDLKQMIADYILNIFDTKSYIENDIMFNEYLLVFNSIKNITKEIKNMYTNDNVDK